MNQLYIREGDIVMVQNVSLSLATFSKFQPQSVDFLDITNPKAVYPPLYHHPVQLKRPGSLIPRHTYPQILGYGCLGMNHSVILPLTSFQLGEQTSVVCVPHEG